MPLRLDHVEVAAHDPAALAHAYAVAGLTARVEAGAAVLDGGRGRIVLRQASEAPRPDRLRACDPGIAHVCLQSVTPDAMWQGLADAGMAWNAEPLGLGTGYTYAYGYDREGNLVELEGTGNAWQGRDTWLAHAAIVTPDLDRARDFYADLLGIRSHAGGRFRHPNMGPIAALDAVEASAAWFDTAALSLELWSYLTPPTGPRPAHRPTGYRRLGLVADNLPAECARIAAAGIALTPEATGEDPDGNAFRILGPA